MANERLGDNPIDSEATVTTTPFGTDPSRSSTPAVNYCGVTFASNLISGTSVSGSSAAIVRSDIRGLAVHAVVSRGEAITQTIGSIVLFGIAGAVGLSAIGFIHLLGNSFLGGRGIHVGIIIAVLAPAVRLLSTAWDPRHLLVVTTRGEGVTLVLKPTPEPFELIKTIEDVQKRLDYIVELYPEQSTANERSSV